MTHPECFGREYVDESGDECPHEDCLLRYECRQVFATAKTILSTHTTEAPSPTKSKTKTTVAPAKKKRGGYAKPGKLLYVDEGTLRDSLLFEVKEYLESFGFQTKATKCLHSFLLDKKRFLLKIDTRRKNSILLYINDDLSDSLDEEGFRCRALFDSEKPNFPPYLTWVITIRSESEVERFKSGFEKYRATEHDTQ